MTAAERGIFGAKEGYPMSDTDDRTNLEDEPDTEGEDLNNEDDDIGGETDADDSVPTSGAAPDPGESGLNSTARSRPTI